MKSFIYLFLIISLLTSSNLFAATCANAVKGRAVYVNKSEKLVVPSNPIIPVIPGDGIGPEIVNVMRTLIDKAVFIAYGGKRKISWLEVLAGESAAKLNGDPLPAETIEALKKYRIAIKGPTGTPTGKGHRSVNVRMRQILNLSSNIRPVSYRKGIPSPLKNPESVNLVIFRQNTEDTYAGIEFAAKSTNAVKLIEFIRKLDPDVELDIDAAIGIKPITEAATKAHMRRAMEYAIAHGLQVVTVVHKGNIMKLTEGAFLNWSFELAQTEYRDKVITEAELWDKFKGNIPDGKIVLKSRIADAMFMETKLRADSHNVLVTPNLIGDFMSDDVASLAGGLGVAPGANVGKRRALFEAVHGTAPDIAGQNKANPTSLLMSASMMLEYMGWKEAKQVLDKAIDEAFNDKVVTGDLGTRIPGATIVSTSEFGDYISKKMDQN